MGNDARLTLAIRTIVVTTRAAVRSNAKIGRPDLASETAQRGVELLDGIGPVPPELRDALDAAREELARLAGQAEADVAISVGDDSPLPEDLDVRPKLRP